MRAALFIDGGYFLSRLKEEGSSAAEVDFKLLADYLLTPLRRGLPLDILRCYFYHCPPWMSDAPGDAENRRMAAHHVLVDEIEGTNRWQVRLGKLERRWDGKEEYFEQKRVDVMLSVDLVRHAAAGHIQHAVLVAGDSDFIPAVAAAKESGVTVSIWGGATKTVHPDLTWMADELHRLDVRTIQKRAVTPPRKERSGSGGGRGPGRGGQGRVEPRVETRIETRDDRGEGRSDRRDDSRDNIRNESRGDGGRGEVRPGGRSRRRR